jgi:CheY-like chemotaxis protein
MRGLFMRIAICDDTHKFTKLIESYLEQFKRGHSKIAWEVFANGEALARRYQERGADYDVVLLDME